jgi:hypothetical protein
MAAAAQQGGPLPRRIRYVHGLAEDCGLDSGSVDLITYQVSKCKLALSMLTCS